MINLSAVINNKLLLCLQHSF